MKIRTGFVSNSSSSSFYVAVPKGEKLEETAIWKLLGVDKNSLAGQLLQAYVEFFKEGEQVDLDQLMSDYGAHNIEELKRYCRNDPLIEMIENGWYVTRREASNEDYNGIGRFLHDAEWKNIDTDKLKIIKWG